MAVEYAATSKCATQQRGVEFYLFGFEPVISIAAAWAIVCN